MWSIPSLESPPGPRRPRSMPLQRDQPEDETSVELRMGASRNEAPTGVTVSGFRYGAGGESNPRRWLGRPATRQDHARRNCKASTGVSVYGPFLQLDRRFGLVAQINKLVSGCAGGIAVRIRIDTCSACQRLAPPDCCIFA